jgi:PAS domain S-box-containing protein/putative nucleotidyltransferase with HDIG domain
LNKFRILPYDSGPALDIGESFFQKDLWTIEVIRLTCLATIIPGLLVLGLHIMGILSFQQSIPVYLAIFLLFASWVGAKRGGWQWAGYIPAAISFFYGTYLLYQTIDFRNTTIFIFCFSIILSGMLQGKKTGIFYSCLSAIVFISILFSRYEIHDLRYLPSITSLFIGILVALLLQNWYANRLKETLEERFMAGKKVEEEQIRRQQIEAIQQRQESLFSRLADSMTDLVGEIDINGVYLYVSPSYFPMLGYHPEDLLGKNAFSFIHPDDIDRVRKSIELSRLNGVPSITRYRFKHADGHYIWLETSGNSRISKNGEDMSVVFSTRDISIQKNMEENLQSSELRFRSIIEAIPIGIHQYYLDENGELIFSGFNPAADKILHFDHRTVLGKRIQDAFTGLEAQGLVARYKDVAIGGKPMLGQQVEITYKEWTNFFEIGAFQTEPGKITEMFSDITERRKAEEALKLSEEKFSKAFHMSPDAVSITRIQDGLFIEANEGFTRFSGHSCEEVVGKTSFEINIWVDLKDREKLVEDLKKNGYCENLLARFWQKDGKIIFGLMSARLLRIKGEDYLLSITRNISDRIEAEQKMQEAHTQVEKAYEATLQGWARALELREHETANHSRRVVELSLKIARELGFSPVELIDLERGALLHDIGKMGVPDNILLKPGPLSSDEWVIMKQHPENAYHLLKDVEYLRQALEIPYSHHEHWDGSGYPRGLKGDEIPLSARIFAIVDVWDALLSDRPYRPAWNKQAVLKYMDEQSGILFDPKIIDVFIRLVNEE